MHTTLAHGTNSVNDLVPNVAVALEIEELWDDVEPFIERSVAHTPPGMFTVSGIKGHLLAGRATLLYTSRDSKIVAVFVVYNVNYATYSAARIIACAGRELREAYRFIAALEAWAITTGAVELEAWCRPAMVRLLRRYGFQPKTTLIALDLRRKLQ